MRIGGQRNPTLLSANSVYLFRRVSITRLTRVSIVGPCRCYTASNKRTVPIHVSFTIGNSTPRFLRPTIYAVPASAELQSLTHVPFGIHINPLAQQAPEEAPIPAVDFGETGPPRCGAAECRAYINPWCTWEGGGLRWVCNLCGTVNDGRCWIVL
jgi:hypothetical protein